MGSVSPRSVVITGASSGIGRALALDHAAPGIVVGLIGRNRMRLEQVAAECHARGAETKIGEIDVCERSGLADWLKTFDDEHAIELLVANAGVLVRQPGAGLEPA